MWSAIKPVLSCQRPCELINIPGNYQYSRQLLLKGGIMWNHLECCAGLAAKRGVVRMHTLARSVGSACHLRSWATTGKCPLNAAICRAVTPFCKRSHVESWKWASIAHVVTRCKSKLSSLHFVFLQFMLDCYWFLCISSRTAPHPCIECSCSLPGVGNHTGSFVVTTDNTLFACFHIRQVSYTFIHCTIGNNIMSRQSVCHTNMASRPVVCCNYRIVSSKRPWALDIDGPKTGVGTYTEKPFVCITHTYMWTIGSSKRGMGAYTEIGAYLREYGWTAG